MNTLNRWDPLRDFLSVRDMMERFFDNPLYGQQNGWQEVSYSLPLDVAENEDEYIVKASIPGIHPDDVEVTFTNNTLTLKGEVKADQEVDEKRYHLRERRYGRFVRSLSLPSRIQAEAIEASYQNGELTLRLPKTEEVKPKRISIRAEEAQQKMIEGKFDKQSRKN